MKTLFLAKSINLRLLILNSKRFLIGPLNSYFFLPLYFRLVIKNHKLFFKSIVQEMESFNQQFSRWLKHCQRVYKKKLVLHGLGFKVSCNLLENYLELKLGFSHIIKLHIPLNIIVHVEKSIISISSINPVLLGNFIYNLRNLKPLNIYKGKGILYKNEKFILKEIKKA